MNENLWVWVVVKLLVFASKKVDFLQFTYFCCHIFNVSGEIEEEENINRVFQIAFSKLECQNEEETLFPHHQLQQMLIIALSLLILNIVFHKSSNNNNNKRKSKWCLQTNIGYFQPPYLCGWKYRHWRNVPIQRQY